MNKFKKYLKENYKRLLLIILIIVGYIGLLFACKYVNNDIKENVPTIQDNRKRVMQDNNNYWSTSGEYNYIGNFELDPNDIDYQFDVTDNAFPDEFYVEEYVLSDSFYSYINFGVSVEVGDLTIPFSYFEFYMGIPFTNLSSIQDNQYYYFYVSMNTIPLDGTIISSANFSISNLINQTSYSNPIIKGSFIKENFENLGITIYCDTYNIDKRFFTGGNFIFVLGLYELSSFIDFNYDNGYNDGIGTATDINYNSSVFKNYNQFTMNYNQYSIVYDVSNRNINEFPYTFNPTLNGLDTGNLYNDIVDLVGESSGYNISLTSNYNILGVGGIKWSTYQSGGNSPVQQINLLDNNNNIIVSFDEQHFIFDDHFYYTFDIPREYENYVCKFQFLIYINYLPSSPWMISLISNGTFESGLQQGIEQGKQDVLNNLGQYYLYDREQYLNYGESQKEIGIDIGQTRGCSVNNLFFAIADIPTRILSSLLSFELFGINMFVAFGSIATLLLIIWVIRKVK